MTGYGLIVPELLVIAAAAWALFAERLVGGDRGAAWVGAGACAVAGLAAAAAPASGLLFGGLLGFDGAAKFARVGIALLAALWLLWTAGRGTGRVREAVALALLATVGAMLMCEARDLITLVLAVELATMPAYVLMGYRRQRLDGLEGAIKYFLLSMLTSLVMLYGMSFLYGVTGTTRYAGLDLSQAGSLGVLAVLLTFVGLFAKLSAAPFHYWAPDAYAGAEPWSVAFVSTVPKVAGAVALVRLTAALAPSATLLAPVLLVGAVLSMLLGNLAALTQDDLRRMMAYSGVAHTGYLLLGTAALSGAGFRAAILYSVAYALPSLGIMLVLAEEGPALGDVAGLAQRRPAAAWAVVVMLLSLIGVPPLVGFFGKFFLFGAALQAHLTWWVVLGIVMSVVSAGYYLRIVRSMFFAEPDVERPAVGSSWPASVSVGLAAVLTVALGLAAGQILQVLSGSLL